MGDILGTLEPYMQDYIRRDGRFQDGFGIHITSFSYFISIQASAISSAIGPVQKVTFATFTVIHRQGLLITAEDKLCIDFVGYTPREHIVYSGGNLNIDTIRGDNRRNA